MSNIKELKGKRKILEMFPANFNPISSFNDYTESEYLEILEMVERNIPFKKDNANLSLCLFLYSGCLKFDRFTVPTPYVFNPENNKLYYRFLEALIKAEKGLSHNTLSFSLKKIKGQVYEKFDQVVLK
ncbi:MAG: hypothetical protein ACR2PX_01460 [Endozoicomonas sp.]|uniref:hypothetical protein n=1 Tax=Endozoicomonas sp. TaxID=1892382 RepID=UPI003D9BC110